MVARNGLTCSSNAPRARNAWVGHITRLFPAVVVDAAVVDAVAADAVGATSRAGVTMDITR